MKGIIYLILGVLVLGGGGYYAYKSGYIGGEKKEGEKMESIIEGAEAVTPGEYIVSVTESKLNWSLGKPLIEGYVNSGTIGLSSGSINVLGQVATGSFTLDMNTIKVGLTPKKPGKEGALETHLKSEDFFDVENFPTGGFKITEVVPNEDSSKTFVYGVKGELTLKGKSNPVEFPATIYLKEGNLHTKADLTIDRTKWGITYGSPNFFENLADNAIGDNITISLHLIANPASILDLE